MKSITKATFPLAIIALLAFPVLSNAQTTKTLPLTAKAPQKAVVSTQTTVATDPTIEEVIDTKEELLSAKKVRVEAQLRDILNRLTIIHTRTQLAVDRLNVKEIDTEKSQTALVEAKTALATAKLNIDAFGTIVVDDTASDKALVEMKLSLKEAAKKSETALKDARTALIQSLAHLKLSINLSFKADGAQQ